MKVNPYLTFGGNCEAALNFYREALEGEIVSLSYFDSTQMPVPEEYKKKVLHGVLQFGQSVLMASDSLPEHPLTVGNNVSLSVDFAEPADMEAKFNALAAGGQVTMALQDTFWGARFGMLTDQFGIRWMLNCELKK
jgi:PhnB protein